MFVTYNKHETQAPNTTQAKSLVRLAGLFFPFLSLFQGCNNIDENNQANSKQVMKYIEIFGSSQLLWTTLLPYLILKVYNVPI